MALIALAAVGLVLMALGVGLLASLPAALIVAGAEMVGSAYLIAENKS